MTKVTSDHIMSRALKNNTMQYTVALHALMRILYAHKALQIHIKIKHQEQKATAVLEKKIIINEERNHIKNKNYRRSSIPNCICSKG